MVEFIIAFSFVVTLFLGEALLGGLIFGMFLMLRMGFRMLSSWHRR